MTLRLSCAALLLLAAACATPPPPPKKIQEDPNAPIAYPPLEPRRAESSTRFGFVSERDSRALDAAIDSFTKKAWLYRDSALHGAPMPALQLANWRELLKATDAFLAAGVAPSASQRMIRVRTTIEAELEADAQVYAQIPPSLIDDVLEHETRLGLRMARIQRASEERQAPAAVPPPTVALPSRVGFGWPVQPVRITSLFGRRFHPIFKRYREHQGLDLAAGTGQDVFAAQGGTVIAAGPAGGHGNQVQLQHANGLVTRYSHLSRILVRVGEALSRGDRLGLAGRTGDATGPHLHFELWRGSGPVDPLEALGLPGEASGGS